MELDGTSSIMLKAQNKINKYVFKTKQPCQFPLIMTWLLKIIHRDCYEQFHVRTISFHWTTHTNRIT